MSWFSRKPETLPYVESAPRVEVFAIEPGDLVVITGTKAISRAQYDSVREDVRAAMASGAAVVLGDGLSIYVSHSGPREGQRVTPSTTGVTDDGSNSSGLDPGDA